MNCGGRFGRNCDGVLGEIQEDRNIVLYRADAVLTHFDSILDILDCSPINLVESIFLE